MRRTATLGLALALLAWTSAAPAWAESDNPPPPGIGIRLAEAPTEAADDPRAHAYIVDHVSPGSVIRRQVEISNGGPDRAAITVYAGAAGIGSTGFSGSDGRQQNELSGWVTATPRTSFLAPGDRRMVDVEIAVPRDASRGERYAVVWAQTTAPPDARGLTHVVRVGVRIYLSVGPGGAPPTDFTVSSLTAQRSGDGVPQVVATVRNTGERALDLQAELTLSEGPGSMSAGPFVTDRTETVGIGQTGSVIVDAAPELPEGPWLASVEVTSGVESRTAEATLTFPGAPGTGDTVEVREGGVPWAVVAALLLLPAGVLAVRRARVRARQRAG